MMNWKNLLLFFLTTACFLIGLIPAVSIDLLIRIEGIGLLLAMILYLRLFLRKNYIGYTQMGIIVRTGRHGGKMFRYCKLQDASINKGLLQLNHKNGIQLVVDLDDADPKEIGKLRSVLDKKFSKVA